METEYERSFESVLAEVNYNEAISLASESQRGQDGLEEFRQAFELMPAHPLYGLDYALALHQDGQKELAQAVASVAIQNIHTWTDPDDPEPSNWLEDAEPFTLHRIGLVYSMVLDDAHSALTYFAEAATHLRKAVELAPDLAMAWAGYQFALFGLGQFEESLDLGRQLEKAWPDIEEIRFNNASCLLNLGRYHECEQEKLQAALLIALAAWNSRRNKKGVHS